MEIIHDLHDAGNLSNTLWAMGFEPLPGEDPGNCVEVAQGLMTDLIMAQCAQGWNLVKGHREEDRWEHTWLECDGWAVDASNSFLPVKVGKFFILIDDAHHYRRETRRISKILTVQNAGEFFTDLYKNIKDQMRERKE